MYWKLEVVVVPVADVDRAKRFYSEQVGFVVDHDPQVNDEMRFVQLTPPGSACSIVIGTGGVAMLPGSVKGLQLVVSDIEAARSELVERGVGVSPIQHYEGATLVEGCGGGVSVMDFQARRKKTPESRRRELYELYLRRHDRINNWDLVDRPRHTSLAAILSTSRALRQSVGTAYSHRKHLLLHPPGRSG